MVIKTKRLKEIINKYNYLLNKYDEVCIYESFFECGKCSEKWISINFEKETLFICECWDDLHKEDNNDNN